MIQGRTFAERLFELQALGCGCGVGIGLLIMGACAGSAVGSAKMPGLSAAFGVLAAIVIVALVYFVTRKTAQLRAAQAHIETLKKEQSESAGSEPLQ